MFNNTQKSHAEPIDKSFFCIYLNQARLNAYIALCDISERLGVNTVEEDSISIMPILDFLKGEKDVRKSQSAFRLIEKHFPMLKIMYYWQKEKGKDDDLKERSKKYKDILTGLLEELNLRRNEYCHACSKIGVRSYDINQLIRCLEDCFDASVRWVKGVRKLDEKEVVHLRRKISQGRGKEKRTVDNPGFYYHFKDKQGQLTEKGIAYLASIFLEKKDAHEFLKKQEYFKNDSEPKYQATLESFYHFRIKLPKPVMTSDVDKDGLALDMLNDLKKCPKELFELLSKDDQKDFRKTDSEDTDEDGGENLMMRYSDRFPYLALRYCDENEVFKNLRFQIDLGRYYFKFYEKETIDGNKEQRALDKRLKTFGRIKGVKNEVEKEWGGITRSPDEINEKQNEPYKEDSTPHYNLVDNQIGFVISGDSGLPDIKQPDGKIKLKEPDAWLSVYELPGMLFHGFKCGFEGTEILINKYIRKQRKICEEIFETGNIPQDAGEYLPESLKDIKTSDTKQNDYAKNKLERMLEDTNQRIKAIKATQERMADPSNKPGKKKFFDIRAGKLANFLAMDIIALQKFDPDKKGKDKLTSLNYQVLQATLAYYGAKKDTIREMFQKIGLLDGANPHPFLKEIDPAKHNSIVEYYKAYLNRKHFYLESCKKAGKYDEQFLRPSRQRYAQGGRDLKTIARNLLDNPVNIPKDLFEKEIKELVCNEDASLKDRKMNTAYMIKAYFEKTQGRQQPFYGCCKTYPVVVKAKEYITRNRGISKTLQSIVPTMSYKDMEELIEKEIPEKGRFDPETLKQNLLNGCKDFKNNERLLRRFKVQDMIAFMMVEKTLKEQLSFKGNALKLEAITTEKSFFKNPILCNTDIKLEFNTSPKHSDKVYVKFIKDNYEGLYASRGNKILLEYRVTSENTKLKDIGKYRRYLYDRRSPGLLIWKYQPNTSGGTEIKYADIEQEIKAYEQHRKYIAQQLYMLEKRVIEHYGLKLEKKVIERKGLKIEEEESHIPFNRIIDTVKANLPDCEDKCNTLLNIRNSVYHNQFPVCEEAIEKAEGKSIAEKMKVITENYIEQITMKGFANV